jgi:hypothetical protein
MDILNASLTGLTELLWYPLRALPSVLVLVVWAVVAGALAGLMFRYTSNQKALARVGDQIKANLLAMRLFKQDLLVTFRCQAGLLKAAAQRFWYALPAFVVMLVPFLLLLVQLALRYEYRPLRPGETAIVEIQVAPQEWAAAQNVLFEAPPGVAIQTPALRDARANAIYWRISPQSGAGGVLRWRVAGQTIEKTLAVCDDPQRLCAVSVERPGSSFWDRLLNPGEPALPADSPVRAVMIRYPSRQTPVFGFNFPWWATFLVASILAAFVLKPVLKVRF